VNTIDHLNWLIDKHWATFNIADYIETHLDNPNSWVFYLRNEDSLDFAEILRSGDRMAVLNWAERVKPRYVRIWKALGRPRTMTGWVENLSILSDDTEHALELLEIRGADYV
jgi:hypothetical protein